MSESRIQTSVRKRIASLAASEHPWELATLLLACLLCPPSALANPDPTPDPGAAIVLLRTDCGDPPLENCFESMESLSDVSTGWIWTTRTPTPSASAPLLIDIGPGDFGGFTCDGGSHVTLRGAGREHSILRSASAGAEIIDCDVLAFLDLGFEGSTYGVRWFGPGASSWSNVDLVATGVSGEAYIAGWADSCTGLPPVAGGPPPHWERSVHYFHGSRVRTTGVGLQGTFGYISDCAETWFYGGEVLVDAHSPTSFGAFGIFLRVLGDFRAFGTTIRTRASGTMYGTLTGVDSATSDPTAFGLSVPAGSFHAHGSIINTSAVPGHTNSVNVVALSGTGHTPGTAFVLNASGAGTTTRLAGVARSPFLWEPGPTPPTASGEANELISKDGQDMFVETDCAANGDCTAGNRSHLMVFDNDCDVDGPWLDVVTGRCRGDTTP